MEKKLKKYKPCTWVWVVWESGDGRRCTVRVALLNDEQDGFDLVLGSDIVIAGFDTDKLCHSIMALLSRQKDSFRTRYG
eukprot:6052264-Amphidinium_carterae.1